MIFLSLHADSDEVLTLLITPESMLLSYGGAIIMLPGIPGDTSDFSAPELYHSNSPPDIEKVYTTAIKLNSTKALLVMIVGSVIYSRWG